ncbi:MAG TPA: SpoIVB peptidase S55 domain-containing protein, partial [Abditibacteriaceae bacterium]
MAALLLCCSVPLFAQTKPKTNVPTEEKADAKSLVQTLLKEGKIIRSSEIKRGMKGIARSVFQGTTIEEFQVEALGRLERVNGGGDIVLIRVLDGPVVKRQSGIIAGMSGSPVYFNGKMLGAIA